MLRLVWQFIKCPQAWLNLQNIHHPDNVISLLLMLTWPMSGNNKNELL